MASEGNTGSKNITPQSLISEKHVKAALEADKGEGTILKSWEVKNFTSQGDNYACMVTSIQVYFSHYDQTSNVSYIVKLNPSKVASSSDEIWHILFVKEIGFYSSLLPKMNSHYEMADCGPIKVPRFYYSCHEGGHDLIFLEDLRVRGFKLLDRQAGMNLAHLKLALRALGKLHAGSFLLTETYKTSGQDFLRDHDYLEKNIINFNGEDDEKTLSLIVMALDKTLCVLENETGYEKAISWLKCLRSQVSDILQKRTVSTRLNVICHGDTWNNNMLFRYNDEGHPIETMLIDFQVNRYASPATDLCYLLYSSVEADIRRPNFDSLLSIYYNCFKDCLEVGGVAVPITEEELKQEFREQVPFGAVMGMLLIPIVLRGVRVAPAPDGSPNAGPDMPHDMVSSKVSPEVVPNVVPDVAPYVTSDSPGDFDELKGTISSCLDDMVAREDSQARKRMLAMFDEFLDEGICD